jgi:hypothetical protein
MTMDAFDADDLERAYDQALNAESPDDIEAARAIVEAIAIKLNDPAVLKAFEFSVNEQNDTHLADDSVLIVDDGNDYDAWDYHDEDEPPMAHLPDDGPGSKAEEQALGRMGRAWRKGR